MGKRKRRKKGEEKYKPWYSVYTVELEVERLLGSIPAQPEMLKHVRAIYERLAPERVEELAQLPEEEVVVEERMAGRCVFRRDADGRLCLAQGQVVGLLEEAVRAAGLGRRVRNVPLTLFTEPDMIPMVDADGNHYRDAEGEEVRPIRTPPMRGRPPTSALTIHEVLENPRAKFDLLTTNKQFNSYADQIFDIARRQGLGPGRKSQLSGALTRLRPHSEAQVEEDPVACLGTSR